MTDDLTRELLGDTFDDAHPGKDEPTPTEQERVAGAISLLLHASEVDGGIHSLESAHDGDGWTEPFSDHYWCGCVEPGDGSPLWSIDWMQKDPEQSDKPDPTQVLLAWAEHVDAATEASWSTNRQKDGA